MMMCTGPDMGSANRRSRSRRARAPCSLRQQTTVLSVVIPPYNLSALCVDGEAGWRACPLMTADRLSYTGRRDSSALQTSPSKRSTTSLCMSFAAREAVCMCCHTPLEQLRYAPLVRVQLLDVRRRMPPDHQLLQLRQVVDGSKMPGLRVMVFGDAPAHVWSGASKGQQHWTRCWLGCA